jgi:uncharacterized protein YdaU (DUF1376 family)
MQLYVADYLADTAHLTTEEHGAYLLLLFSYWQTGKPLRADRLASVSRMSNERWACVEQTLSEFFDVKKGLWTHFRVEADLEKVGSKSKKNSEAGKKSAKARALAKQSLEDADPANVSTNVEQTYQRNVNHTDTDTDTDKEKDQKPLSLDEPNDVGKLQKIPYEEIRQLYAVNLPTLPQVKLFDQARKNSIKSRWNADPRFQKLEFWEKFFQHIAKSKFLMGQTNPPWHGCCFDWIFKPANFKKIVEGNYSHE